MSRTLVCRYASARLYRWFALTILGTALILLVMGSARAQPASLLETFLQPATLAEVFPGAGRTGPKQGDPPVAPAYKGDQLLGYVFLNSDVVNSTGYSGKPIRILVGINLGGRIVGAKLVEQHEPIVLIGIPAAKLSGFIHSYVGQNAGDAPNSRPAGRQLTSSVARPSRRW